jgi:hypothetical protein
MSRSVVTALIAFFFIAQVPGGEAQIVGKQLQNHSYMAGNSDVSL